MKANNQWLLPRFNKVLPLFPYLGNGSDYIFEADLSLSCPPVDFSLCFLKSQAVTLLNHWNSDTITQEFANNPLWQRLKQFVSEWQEEGTLLNAHIADIWFEFDHHQLQKELPEPCFFFSPRPLFQFPDQNLDKMNHRWVFDIASVLFRGSFLSQKVRQNISLCFASLPARGNVFQVGLMLSRNNPEPLIRLCTSLPIHLYTSFLEAIGWTGSITDLKTQLRTIARYVDSVFIDIDVGEKINTPIGLECSFKSGTDTEQRLQDFLSFLISQQLATPENVDYVQTWIRDIHVPVLFASHVEEKRFKRVLSHVKLVLNSDNSLKAKAYLSLSHQTG